MKIGFIGLGNIGSVFAGHLLAAKYDLTINDLRPEAAKELLAAGAKWSDDTGELAATVDVLVTSLPGPPQVRAVMDGEAGALARLRPGTTWIDLSTTAAEDVKRMGTIAADRGIAMLEAPVTGGLALAKEGGITVLVGGDKKAFEANLPLLQVMGGQILHMGPLGSAAVVKVITNLLALGHLLMAGEAFMLGKQAGIDATALLEGIKASSGNSYTIEQEIPLVYNGSYDVGFSLALANKDLGLVCELGRKYGVPLELGSLVEQLFIRATAQYGPDKNSTQAVKLLEDNLGVYMRADGY